jgi:hypothetical protein
MATPKMFSLNDLDITKQCEGGFEFEVTDDTTGKGTGVYLTVVGAHAESVQKFTSKKLNERRVFDDMNERRGKKAQVRRIEDDVEFGIELAAIRITGWRGISDEFTPANAIKLCTVNPTIREQILKASEDLANFTKASAKI